MTGWLTGPFGLKQMSEVKEEDVENGETKRNQLNCSILSESGIALSASFFEKLNRLNVICCGRTYELDSLVTCISLFWSSFDWRKSYFIDLVVIAFTRNEGNAPFSFSRNTIAQK